MKIEKNIYEKLYHLETHLWWFESRRSIIMYLIRNIIKPQRKLKILDIGCGTGSEIDFFTEFGEITGIDSSKEAINLCLKRGLEKKVIEANAEKLSFPDEIFDLILCLDVLEHIQYPEFAIAEISRLLKKEGFVVLTVPAFAWLWSEHDKVSGHFKRYNIKELKSILQLKNFKLIKMSYFNTFLFPAIVLLRKFKNFIGSKDNDFAIPIKPINWFLKCVFDSEKFFLKYLDFPFGISIITIIQKI